MGGLRQQRRPFGVQRLPPGSEAAPPEGLCPPERAPALLERGGGAVGDFRERLLRRESGLDFLVGGERRVGVLRQRGPVGGLLPADFRPEAAAVEDRGGDPGEQAPDREVPVHQSAQPGGSRPHGAGEPELRVARPPGDGRELPRGRQPPLGAGHIRPPRDQVRRDAGRRRGDLPREAGVERPAGPRGAVGVVGHQDLDGADGRPEGLPAARRFRMRLGGARLGGVHRGQRDLADPRPPPHPARGLLPVRRRGLGEAGLFPGLHREEVEPRRLPGEGDAGARRFQDRRLEPGVRRPRPGRRGVPQRRLPGQVEREPVGHIFGGEDFAFGEAGDRQADEVPPLGQPGRAGVGAREQRAPRGAGFRGGLRQPRRRPFEVEVARQRAFHHEVEFPLAEGSPPVGGGGAGGLRRRRRARLPGEVEFRFGDRRPEPGAAAGRRGDRCDGEGHSGCPHIASAECSNRGAAAGGALARRFQERRLRPTRPRVASPRWRHRGSRAPAVAAPLRYRFCRSRVP